MTHTLPPRIDKPFDGVRSCLHPMLLAASAQYCFGVWGEVNWIVNEATHYLSSTSNAPSPEFSCTLERSTLRVCFAPSHPPVASSASLSFSRQIFHPALLYHPSRSPAAPRRWKVKPEHAILIAREFWLVFQRLCSVTYKLVTGASWHM